MFKELNILKLFFEEPGREFNVREVARLAKTAPATASAKLKEFEKNSILKHRKERMLGLYKADLESASYRDLKVYYSIRKIRESGLIESFNEFYIKPTIILFGSCSKGIDTETSDMDIVIISEKTKNKLKNNYNLKNLGSATVKGKKEKISIYSIDLTH